MKSHTLHWLCTSDWAWRRDPQTDKEVRKLLIAKQRWEARCGGRHVWEFEDEIRRKLSPRERKRNRAYRNWLRRLVVGDIVGACYDGKESRKCRGVVVRRLSKGIVYVRFVAYASDDTEQTVKFRKGEGYAVDSGLGGYHRLRPWTIDDEAKLSKGKGASELITRAVVAHLSSDEDLTWALKEETVT
jgi:hypothetical protein